MKGLSFIDHGTEKVVYGQNEHNIGVPIAIIKNETIEFFTSKYSLSLRELKEITLFLEGDCLIHSISSRFTKDIIKSDKKTFVIKQLILQLVDKIPLKNLRKLFNIVITDPEDIETIRSSQDSILLREKLLELEKEKAILIEININL